MPVGIIDLSVFQQINEKKNNEKIILMWEKCIIIINYLKL